MLIALLVGLIIGFVMCIPIGPINVWVINTQIKHGHIRALALALGGSIMDLIYFFVILSGLSVFDFPESATSILKITGIILIFIMGLIELFSKKEKRLDLNEKPYSTSGVIASFVIGVILYTSNPTLLITMTALGAFVNSLSLFEAKTSNHILVSLGLSLGSFFWFFCLSQITSRYEQKIKTKYLKKFSQISGSLMILLSAFMGYKFYFKGS